MPEGVAYRQTWEAARAEGATHCYYCRSKFTLGNPPTFDHVVPRALGGTADDGRVFACLACNNARATAPYEAYLEAVEAERVLCRLEDRPYRRPKFRKTTTGAVVTTLPPWAVRVVSKDPPFANWWQTGTPWSPTSITNRRSGKATR